MHRVVITGMGFVSALGDAPEALHSALCAGCSGVRPLRAPLDGYTGVEIADFAPQAYVGDKNFRPLDRTAQLTISAVHLVLEASGWSVDRREAHEVGLVLGTMFCSVRTIAEFDRRAIMLGPSYVKPLDFANTVINAASGQTAIWHRLRGINSTISTGISSGLQAVAYAADLIRSGRTDAVVAGGGEELCFESLYGFAHGGLLAGWGHPSPVPAYPVPFDARRNGFAPGEAAAFLMLEDREAARTRGAAILAEIAGYGTAYDPSYGRMPRAATDAILQAMGGACRDADIPPSAIDGVSASANGSVHADRYEAQALAGLFGDRLGQLPITAVKSMLGESMGASGALQVVDMIQSMQTGVLPGIPGLEQFEDGFPRLMASARNRHGDIRTALINSVNYDGPCCSLIIRR